MASRRCEQAAWFRCFDGIDVIRRVFVFIVGGESRVQSGVDAPAADVA
jgi:hypothetical protein